MKLLIFDSNNPRALKLSQTLSRGADVLLKRGNGIVNYADETPVSGPVECSLILVHKDGSDDAILLQAITKGLIKGEATLPFSGSGCEDGIPWPINASAGINETLAENIIEICTRFAPEERGPQFKALWSGVPDLLVAWAMARHFMPERTDLRFEDSEVADSYNKLRASLLLRPGISGLPRHLPEGVAPSLGEAKLLIELARVDL